MKIKKHHIFIANIVVYLLYFIVILFAYWLFYPYKPLTIKEPLTILNENKTVRIGELLVYRADFTKNTKIKPVITRKLVDGIVYSLPNVTPSNPPGQGSKSAGIDIPINLPPGEYYLESEACYKMNPLRTVCITYFTEQFKVIN